jgi:zinc transport system substrate-binding protein
MPNFLSLFLCLCTLTYALFSVPSGYATPGKSSSKSLSITTSINPLGLMLAELTQNTSVSIKVLIPANQSSHDFNLKPKDIEQLNHADLIVWVGPELENFLEKPIGALSDTKPQAVLTLLNAPSLKKQLHHLRSGVQWQDVHHHHDNHPDHDEHDHKHAYSDNHNIDPHIWLSPELNLEIAKLITKKLILLDPSDAKIYLRNFRSFTEQLLIIDKLYREAFSKQTSHRYLVLHDSYQYLEKQYGLTVSGVLSIHPDRPASIKTLREAQKNIAANHVTCIVGEPPFQAKLIRVLLEGQALPKPKAVQLSPLADNFELKIGNYEKWQREMVENLRTCE